MLIGIILALITALIWGINPQLVGLFKGKPIQQQAGTATGALIVAVILTLIFRPTITLSLVGAGLFSGCLWSVACLMQYKSFVMIGHSRAFAISTAFNLVANALAGAILFSEWTRSTQIIVGSIAIALAVVGVFYVSYSDDSEKKGLLILGIVILIIGAFGFAAYNCAPRYVDANGVNVILPQAIGMFGGTCLLYLIDKDGRKVSLFGKFTGKLMVVGLLWGIANLCLINANRINGIAISYTLSQTCVVFSTLISIFLIHEHRTKKELSRTIIGVVLITAGCILIGMTKM